MKRSELPAHIDSLLKTHCNDHAATKNATEDRIENRLIQTHISWVILTGNHAYKIKKPVDFGFVDFTTLEKRRVACLDELRLNRRLAPDLYLEVLPVCKSGEHYLIEDDDDGHEVVDYSLKMVRFDQRDLFDHLVHADRFDPSWMDSLAATIARFHRRTDSAPDSSTFGTPAQLEKHIFENLKTGSEHLKGEFPPDLETLTRTKLDSLSKQILQRKQQHHVRDCHGDLHLKNIVLYNNVPTPFDCIEFSTELRTIDTMNDIAFLIMDCDARKRSDLGYRFLSRYLEQCGDYEGLTLLPLYLSYRAGVRGKVACLLSGDASLSKREKTAQLAEATDYFRLAGSYLAPASPKLIAIGGLSGSGKSHLALLALEHEQAVIIRSDATRKRIAKGHPELSLYGKQMHELTYRAMFEAAALVLQAGFPAILDATFLYPASREAVIGLADHVGVPLTFFWIDTAPELLKERVVSRSRIDNDISDADLQVLEEQLKDYTRPQEPFITYIKDSGQWPA